MSIATNPTVILALAMNPVTQDLVQLVKGGGVEHTYAGFNIEPPQNDVEYVVAFGETQSAFVQMPNGDKQRSITGLETNDGTTLDLVITDKMNRNDGTVAYTVNNDRGIVASGTMRYAAVQVKS